MERSQEKQQKKSTVQFLKEKDFNDDLDNFFDMAYQDTHEMIIIEKDK